MYNYTRKPYKWRHQLIGGACLLISTVLGITPALAEGSYQLEVRDETGGVPTTINGQGFLEYNSSYSSTASGIPVRQRPMFVDVHNSGEVINISACGVDDNDQIRVQIYYHPPGTFNEYTSPLPTGTQVLDQTLSTSTTGVGRVACNDPMNAPLTNPLKYNTDTSSGGSGTGVYEIRFFNNNKNGSTGLIDRFDVTITPNISTNPDPTLKQGRLWAYYWGYRARGYDSDRAVDTNYYIRVPGGFPGTEFVWKLDLNNFAGFAYEILANQLGVDSPNAAGEKVSGLSVPNNTNNSTPQYRIYMSYPADASLPPSPTTFPIISDFRFEDAAGVDNTISPNGTIGVQDSGSFKFTTNVDGTYGMTIDVSDGNGGGPDGVFGPGDVYLTNTTVAGSETVIPWDGTDNFGNSLANGSYNVRLQVRLGEYHFTSDDAETSGGGSDNGLTIFQALSNSNIINTQVYWDDITGLGNPPGGTSTLPNGGTSGTAAGRHTWGSFTGDGFGNLRMIDTYVFGNSSIAFTTAILSDSDSPPPICPAGDTLVSSSGNADSQTNTGVGNPNNALGTPNNNYADLRASDVLTLDLTDSVPENAIVAITITRGNDNGRVTIEASSDGTNFSGAEVYGNPGNVNTTIPATVASGTFETINYTVPAGGARYLRFTRNAGRIRVDAVTYSQICSSSGGSSGNPNIILVKRITRINNSLNNPNDNTPLNTVVDDTTSSKQNDDNNPNWPSNYLLGAIDGGKVKPGDEIEYTIYFLSTGNNTANNVLMCDLVPQETTFVPTAFGADNGIVLSYNGTTLNLTNSQDSDAARYFSPSIEPSTIHTNIDCDGDPGISTPNDNGAVVVDLGNLPHATTPGQLNSYGFFRFRTQVK
ncbi:MAG: hypothetical protein QNJ47_14240 [Nostocaceae cyanobacterium]|nr:hypothetical protein [Nostocaceae cyanobacterium]